MNFHKQRSIDIVNDSKLTTFDVEKVFQAFSDALKQPNNHKSPIGTQDYINGYRELLKFFDQLGYVFKFVKDDVVEKLDILQTFVNQDNNRQVFLTIQTAINYETEYHLIKSNPLNFARTLLRLHRALLFIIQFLENLNERPINESTTIIAATCYDATLAHHHPFLIRQSARFGFRMLPSRRQLDDVIFRGQKIECLEKYNTFIEIIKQIYNTIQGYYTDMKYLQLP